MKQYATWIGIAALIVWSLGPLSNTLVIRIPIFEIVTFCLGCAFLLGLIHLTVTGNWRRLKQPFPYFMAGFAGVVGNELSFVTAFKYAPSSHIVLLNYLWPIQVVSFSWLARKQKFSLRYLIAACLGFISVAYFILKDAGGEILPQYWIGYATILIGSAIWSFYNVINDDPREMPNEMITLYCGVGFVLALVLHYHTETFYLPTSSEMFGLLWLGFMGMGLAYRLWDFGIKYGNNRALSVLSYNNVLLTTGFLILFHRSNVSAALFIAVVGVITASFIAFSELKR